MSDQDKAAPTNGADLDAARREARQSVEARNTDVTNLCALAGLSAEQTLAHLASGVSARDLQAKLAADRAAGAAAATLPAGTGARVTKDEADKATFGTFGEQLVAIVQAAVPGGRRDPRLAMVNSRVMAATPSGMNESVGSEGGFFVAPEVLPGVLEPVYTEDPILSRVTRIPSEKPSVKYLVVDETSRATGSRWGGIQMYRTAEADTATAKKPKLREMALAKKKLMGLAYLTEELMQDAPAAEALITRAFQAELAFSLGNEIFRGNGAGEMQGFLNSGAVVSQAIEASQTIANTAGSIVANVTKMLSRVPASLWGQVIWLYNQELLPYLVGATVGNTPVFLGANGLSGQPHDSIFGRPAFASELCEAVGTVGDIICIAPGEYHMLADGGVTQATSVHVRFIYDEQTLKITHRSDGAPVWRSSVTPFKGSSRSPFVTLAARS